MLGTEGLPEHRPKKTRDLTITLALAGAVVAWQHFLHLSWGARTEGSFFAEFPHMLRDLLLALPVAFLAVRTGSAVSKLINLSNRGSAFTGHALQAAVTSQIFMVLMLGAIPAHGKIDSLLGEGHVEELGLAMVTHALRDAFITQIAAFPSVLLALLALSGQLSGFFAPVRNHKTAFRLSGALLLVTSVLVTPSSYAPGSGAAEAQGAGADPCDAGATIRTYDVSAIDVRITLNQFGDNDPNGMMYVLDNRIADVRAEELSGQVSPGLRQDAIQPLAIRANAGDCLVINFTNQLLQGDASFHVKGLPYTVGNAGGRVGLNPSTLAGPGQTMTYRFPVPTDPAAEGGHQISSISNTRQTLAHGLFGMLMIEPAGSVYLDPEVPGQTIESGWEAIIQDPNGPDFREFVIMMHEIGDEQFEVLDVNGDALPLVEALTDTYRPSSRGLNYRSEPFSKRLELVTPVPDGEKSLGYSSYAFGDPATPIPRSYLGEPTKTRIGHPGSEMFHIYHLHGGGDRWRRNPQAEPDAFTGGLDKTPEQNALSTRMDSQSVGPGENYNLEHECGAGGCQQAAGDFLFHCHIGQHYVAGMWSFWRVFDTVQADLAQMPTEGTTPAVAQAGTSLDLLNTVVSTPDGPRTLVASDDLLDPNQEVALENWVEAQLPPQGVTLDDQDATVWDWTWEYVNGNLSMPLAKGEPETTATWANYTSPTPGARPNILFNLGNGRYSYPLFKPHLAKRPPFSGNGHTGAPWLGEVGDATRPDGLCPSTSRVLQYPLTAIDLPIEVSPGFVDPAGSIYTLNEHKDDIRNGVLPAEPIVLRSNVGDCERLIITSEQEDVNHGGHAKVNVHTHFTQFDPQASDGVISGFSYEQSVKPYLNENRTLDDPADVGDIEIDVTNVNRLRVGIWIGIGLGEGMCNNGGNPVPNPSNAHRPCTEIRQITAIDGLTLTLNEPLINNHSDTEAVGVEFVQSLWYSDVDSGTIFFHDHVDFSNWDHGLFGAHIIEPAGSTWHDPESGAEVRRGTIADIRTPANASVGAGQQGSFRELMVFLTNDSPAVDVNAPGDGPVGLATINLRSAPLAARDGDHPFSSVTNGDPGVVMRAYVGDSVVLRGLGVIEREDSIRITGHRFALERFSSDASLMDSVNLGISEREDMVLEVGAGGAGGYAGDYLIHTGIARFLDAGAWGIMRVHDQAEPDLQPLPDTPTPPANNGQGFPTQTVTGLPPAGAISPGNPCPGGAAERQYSVSFMETLAAPNGNFGGSMFALDSDVADFISGAKEPEPLVLRVAAGECLVIQLTNHESAGNDFAGLNLGKLIHDPQGSSGVAIGFNRDSSLDREEVRTYRFYADQELGTSLFFNLANPRRVKEGGYGAVIVEPAGATWRDPVTGGAIDAGVRADVLVPGGNNFREQVILFQDDDGRIGSDDMPYQSQVQNFAGINYAADRITGVGGRLAANADDSLVYDTATHGDPSLLLEAYAGDPVKLRVGVGTGEASHVFGVDGHLFPWDVNMAGSEMQDAHGLLPNEAFDAYLEGGAGAGLGGGTDYLMGNRRMPFHEAGQWGILRTYDTPQANLQPLFETCGGQQVTVDIAQGQSPTEFSDVILGTPSADTIDGLGGDDIICGQGGGDTLMGGDGQDTLFGGPGSDTLQGGPGADVLYGEEGADELQGEEGNDYLDGGTGVDDYHGGDNDDWLEGGAEGELMMGDDGADTILGYGGNDDLQGGDGINYLWGGTGVDDYLGGNDRDIIDGNDGGEDASEEMDGMGGNDDLLGYGGDDILDGGGGDDYLWGGAGSDTYNGGEDNDYLDGRSGAAGDVETMNGDDGDDRLFGGLGDDLLDGGRGQDFLSGGGGVNGLNGGDDAIDICVGANGGAVDASCEAVLP